MHKSSVFQPAYWQEANSRLKELRVLALAGLVSAMIVVLESFPIFLIGTTLKIYFSFLVVSVGCYLYGPVVGILVGAVSDTIGFMIAGFGEPYFPGYLITAMLSGLIYGVALYRRRVTVLRLAVLKIIINYGSNVLLGSVWKAMLYGKGYYYYFSTGIVKNTLLLPVEIILLVLVFRLILPAVARMGYLPKGVEPQKNIPWF